MADKKDDRKYYDLIPSQMTMYFLVKYSIHKQVIQIPSSITVKENLDIGLLTEALNMEFERNDALRLRFIKTKEGIGIKQYFLDSYRVDKVPFYTFKTAEEQEKFLARDAGKPVHIYNGESFRIFFFEPYDGGTGIYFNVSHIVSDALGAAVFFHDLLCVYKSLSEGTDMPAPLSSYEEHLQKEYDFLTNEKVHGAGQAFYKKYWESNGEPFYAGVHGHNVLDKAREKEPYIRIPKAYDLIHDKAKVAHKYISKEDTEKIYDFCKKNFVVPEVVFIYGLRAHCSKVNYRTEDVLNLVMCSRRATYKDKTTSGCMAQPVQLRTKTKETDTFTDVVKALSRCRNELFRHMNFPYLEALGMQRQIFGLEVSQGPSCFMFSWIPITYAADRSPYKFEFTAHCMGRYVMPMYALAVPDPKKGGTDMYYMYRTNIIKPEHIDLLHENMVKTLEMGCDNPDVTVGEILDSLTDIKY